MMTIGANWVQSGFRAFVTFALLFLIFSYFVPHVAVSETEAEQHIWAGMLLDQPGRAPRENATIVVRGKKIVEVKDGFIDVGKGGNVIDLRDHFVLPGLIDMHVHLLGISGDPMRARLSRANQDDAEDLIWGVANARTTLQAGFTTVRDLGSNSRSIQALYQGIERGDVSGPTIIAAGSMLSVTGGHADYTNGLREAYAEGYKLRQINTCDGPADCSRAVRQQVALGAKVIKFAATGGVLSNVSGGLGRAMTLDEMRAIVETARLLGRKVAAHSHAAGGTRVALELGVDTIEHASFMDKELAQELANSDVYLVPTMLAFLTTVEQAQSGQLPGSILLKAEAAAQMALGSHKLAIAEGVKIAFGTDSGVSRHGENAREFSLMIEAGMTPQKVLQSATTSAAQALGLEKEIGAIKPNMTADIIAVKGNPLKDVARLQNVDFVMRHGTVHKDIP